MLNRNQCAKLIITRLTYFKPKLTFQALASVHKLITEHAIQVAIYAFTIIIL